MDPLAHTLFGATLAEAGLKKKTALAAGTLIIGANLPDIDAIAMLWSDDAALYFRRGWTHGILALIILPFLLTAAMLLFDRYLYRRYSGSVSYSKNPRPPLKPGVLLGISFVAVWSHPFLDLLNTYGVRLLMPFSQTWFYGDTFFIIDPWMWLLTAAAVVLANSKTIPGAAGWIIIGAATTALVLGTAVVPAIVKVLWSISVILILIVRLGGWMRRRTQTLALGCLFFFTIYLALMYIGSTMTTVYVRDALAAQNIEVDDVMAEPLPARIWVRGGVAMTDSHYYLFRINWLNPDSFELTYDPLPRTEPGRIVSAALESDNIRGLRIWMRYPYYEIHAVDHGWQVIIRDLRYVAPDQPAEDGFGIVVVNLDSQLNLL
jgi:inner membrane protein